MTNIQVLAPYAIIDYVWDLLKANTNMKESDYNGRIPVIPSSQQPEFTDINKAFLVYAWSEDTTVDVYKLRTGQIAFAIYGVSDREISGIANLITVALGRWDEAAAAVNDWKVGKPYQSITFMTFSTSAMEGPTPEDQEGGRQSALVMVRYRYATEYEFIAV